MTDIDLLIAQKIMGWSVATFYGIPVLSKPDGITIGQWSPSTSISDAWDVVEHMRNSDARWDFNLCNATFDDGWVAVFRYREHTGRAATAPMAICLAALSTLEDHTAHP